MGFVNAFNKFETVAVREWKGQWGNTKANLPKIDAPAGGYIITFHKGINFPYKAKHYDTVDEIMADYPNFTWLMPSEEDPKDVVMVGI